MSSCDNYWHVGAMQLTLYDWQLTYELVMNYYDLLMTMKYFRENPIYRM